MTYARLYAPCRTMLQLRLIRYRSPYGQLWHRLSWLSKVSRRALQARSTLSSGSTFTLRQSQPSENATEET